MRFGIEAKRLESGVLGNLDPIHPIINPDHRNSNISISKAVSPIKSYVTNDEKLSLCMVPKIILTPIKVIFVRKIKRSKLWNGVEEKKSTRSASNAKYSRNDLKIARFAKKLDAKLLNTCNFCGSYFSGPIKLERHIRKHTNEKPYKCEICGLSFRVQNSLNIHQNNAHFKRIEYKCKYCEKIFFRVAALKLHEKFHLEGKKFGCNFCCKLFLKSDDLEVHIRVHTRERPFICSICKSEFRLRYEMDQHVTAIHLKEKPYKCKRCNKSFARIGSLWKHENEKKNIYKCDLCQKTYAYAQSFKRHKLWHAGELPSYGCTWCGKSFTTKLSLEHHIRRHTGERPYKCNYCSHHSLSGGELTFHIRSNHTKEKPYHCTDCDRTFKFQQNLTSHKTLHSWTGEKEFQCKVEECGKRFRTKASLRNHEKIHNKNRIHKCTYCDKNFKHITSLNLHIKGIHTGEFTLRCTFCEKSFSAPSALREHERVHTGDKPFKCNSCPLAFSISGNLKRHQKLKHQN